MKKKKMLEDELERLNPFSTTSSLLMYRQDVDPAGFDVRELFEMVHEEFNDSNSAPPNKDSAGPSNSKDVKPRRNVSRPQGWDDYVH